MSCGARSLGRFKKVRSQWGKYHGISPAPKAACFGNHTCLQALCRLELIRKENDGWRLPSKGLKARGILSSRQCVLHWGLIKQISVWWRKLLLPYAWVSSSHIKGSEVCGGRCGTSHYYFSGCIFILHRGGWHSGCIFDMCDPTVESCRY